MRARDNRMSDGEMCEDDWAGQWRIDRWARQIFLEGRDMRNQTRDNTVGDFINLHQPTLHLVWTNLATRSTRRQLHDNLASP
jgi:hypothetical protein